MTTSGKLLLRELLIRRFKCDLVILFSLKIFFSFTFHGFCGSKILFRFRFLFSYLQKFSRVSLTNGESATDQHIGRSWIGRLGRHGDWRCKFETKTILRRNNFDFYAKIILRIYFASTLTWPRHIKKDNNTFGPPSKKMGKRENYITQACQKSFCRSSKSDFAALSKHIHNRSHFMKKKRNNILKETKSVWYTF